MAMNEMEKEKVISETVGWFNARVRQHYIDLNDEDLIDLSERLDDILYKHVSNANVQRRQYNPDTDQVEDI